MKTRSSPRNQEILWRSFCGPALQKRDPATVESLERQLTTPHLNARTRRMIERELVTAKRRAAIARAEGGWA